MSKCNFKNCDKISRFNLQNKSEKLFCSLHKLPGMIDITRKRCEFENCKKQPAFNLEDETKYIYCSEHKLPGMVDIKSKRCQHENCRTRPVFNLEGNTKPIYCREHKLPGMVDIKNKRCQHENCKKQPTFNLEGNTKPIYCREHKLPGMVDIKNKRCQRENCKTRPAFNLEGNTKPIYCREHKLPGMVDIHHKRCQHENCKTRPTFNLEGNTKPIYCREHKLIGMVDISNKKCRHENCKTRPHWGFPGNTHEFCARHKENGCVRDPLKKCENEYCKEISIYGIVTELENLRLRCEEHKNKEDILLSARTCKSCSRLDILTRENLCVTYCDPDKFYKTTIKRCRKQKEEIVERLLKEEIQEEIIYRDVVIDSACSRKRPDFGYDKKTHVVFIEVDENQHKTYNCQQEGAVERRMYEIYQSLGGQGCVFIRYNPDSFRDKDGKKVKVTLKTRHDTLLRWIKYCLSMKPVENETDLLRVKYLFYDGYDESNIEFQTITVANVI